MRRIREPAPAKLNLFLRVLGRRPDGYHEVETLIQPLTLADGVEAAARPGGLSLVVTGPLAGRVPPEDDNLIMRAARALAAAVGREPEARLLLAKNVPVAAGLGGGSADAAAALRALNDLWGCGLDARRLAEIGAAVGSDVPALLPGRAVLARGRGERVEPAAVPRTWWVLVTQGFGVAAAEAYSWWDEDGETGPDPGALLASLSEGDVEAAGRLLFNDLEAPVARRHPAVRGAKERLLGAGALGALACGSGPTVGGLARDARQAEEIAAAVGGMVVGSVTSPASSEASRAAGGHGGPLRGG